MRPHARTRGLARTRHGLLALGLALGFAGCGPRADEGGRSEATIVLSSCAGVPLADVQCGVLSVEESRDAPNGRKIELAILVAPATSRAPASDPVFLLAGGPGQGAAAIAPRILHKFDAIRRDRDMVFVDVRGTGGSGPLACEEVEDPNDLEQLLAGTLDLDQLDACVRDYEAEGIDLTQYTTATMVEDLDEVRAGLGYAQINLLAISYGTVVAQVYMRRHGEHLRSAVLDGVVPTDRPVSPQMPANSERALDLLLADCREDSACAAAYPGLERKLARVLEDLSANRVLEEFEHPRSGELTRVDITRVGFVQVLVGMLYSGHMSALLPLLIERAHAGDYAPTAAVALRTARHSKTLSTGLYLSVACAEELVGLDESARRELAAGLEYLDGHVLAELDGACARWPHAEVSAQFHDPVSSDVPTLLLSGRYDPVTPPALAEHLAAQLGDARHVVVGAASHGVWHGGCAPELIAGFFAQPDPLALDPACLDELARPGVFLTANGPWRVTGPDAAVQSGAEFESDSDDSAGLRGGNELAHGELRER